MFTTFEKGLSLLPSEYDRSPEAAEQRVLQSLLDLEWMCNILSKMEMMKDFVSGWACITDHVLAIVQDEKYSSGFGCHWVWECGSSSTIQSPVPQDMASLYQEVEALLDSNSADDEAFPYKMDSDLCQNVEGAISSLVLAQAEILMDWMQRNEQLKYPDLNEAFEVWCYHTKSAKRRLRAGFDATDNPTITL